MIDDLQIEQTETTRTEVAPNVYDIVTRQRVRVVEATEPAPPAPTPEPEPVPAPEQPSDIIGYRWGAANGHLSPPVPRRSAGFVPWGQSESWQFRFDGHPNNLGGDSFAEKRFRLDEPVQQLRLRYQLYLPNGTEGLGPKFELRRVPGGPNNNKFLRLWDADYNDFNVNLGFSTDWVGSPPYLAMIAEWGVDGGDVGKEHGDHMTNGWRIPSLDELLGRWLKVNVFVKLATPWNNDDGVMHMSIDNEPVIANWGIPMHPKRNNYIQNGYLMGWANSGYAKDTNVYVGTDMVITRT